MARPREHLSRAPIIEAVLDFRVLPEEGLTAERFSPLREQLAKSYPTATPMHSVEARFSVKDEPTQVKSDLGWMFRAADDRTRAQFRTNGFTFNRLAPYTTWEEVFSESMRLWQLYVETAKPQEISRLAVRYINRLTVSTPAELSDYLEAPPKVPDPVPQGIGEFLSRIVISDPQGQASAIIIQALEGSSDQGKISILLDIDAFRQASLSPNEKEAVERIFGDLRSLKNTIFYASITERTADQYE